PRRGAHPPADPPAPRSAIAAAVPADPLDAVPKLHNEAIGMEPPLVRRRHPVDRDFGERSLGERGLGLRQEPRERIGAGVALEGFGEAPEELLRRVPAAVTQRGPTL